MNKLDMQYGLKNSIRAIRVEQSTTFEQLKCFFEDFRDVNVSIGLHRIYVDVENRHKGPEFRACEGDWIVYLLGMYRVMSNEEFNREFVRCGVKPKEEG